MRSPLIGRLGGALRLNGNSLGEGGGLGGRLSFAPSDFFAFSDGEGPRTSGFFMAMGSLGSLDYGYGLLDGCFSS
ncbi:MAG: hypothetical protein H0X34_12230 [Chthoniobacterales bacterium]|nr:hypothetical protein [Chthoniobacterales bacterium]